MTTLAIGFDVPFEEAIAAAVARGVVLPETYYGELQGIARQLAFSISGIAVYDQLQAVRDSLAKAMAEGLSFGEWKKTAAAQSLGMPAHRLDNIWRTNLQGNYMRGKWQQFVENKDTHKFLQYDAINDTRVRPSHLAHDGVIRPVNDPFWKTHSPPLGYRCRCSLIAITEKEAKLRSGPGKGLNKIPINPDGTPAEPDKGWDFNPFEDRWQPIKQALADRGKASGASQILSEALAGAVEASLIELYAQWVADHGEKEAKAMWERNYKGQAVP